MNRTSLSFRATWRTRSRSLDTPCPALRPGRVSLAVFPSGRPLPSTTSAPGPPGLFGGFAVLRACLTSRDRASRDYRHSVPLTAHPAPICHPANHPGRGITNHQRATTRSPGSRAWSSSCVPGFSDRAGSTSDSRITPPAVLPSATEKERRHPELVGISRLNSPARTPPVNASLRPHGTPTHDSGPPWIATPSM